MHRSRPPRGKPLIVTQLISQGAKCLQLYIPIDILKFLGVIIDRFTNLLLLIRR
jgi:hypothetical protein